MGCRGEGGELTIPDDTCVVRLQLLESIQRILRGAALPHAYGGVENKNRQDTRGLHKRLAVGSRTTRLIPTTMYLQTHERACAGHRAWKKPMKLFIADS